jgi:hypothetical protein
MSTWSPPWSGQDRRTCWARNDFPLSQAACRDIEQRYGLYKVGAPGQGTRRWPKPAELNKATRQGRPVAPREELRRQLRAAATVAVDEADFFDRLRHDGIEVRLRYSSRDADQVTGYAVALPGHATATGELIFHSGGRLAADLSLPRLRTRWNPDTSLSAARRGAARLNPAPAHVYAHAADILADACNRLRSPGAPDRVAGIVHGTADVLAAMASAWEGRRGGPLTVAADLLDRAAHEASRPRMAPHGSLAFSLRATARLITQMGRAQSDRDAHHAFMLLAAVAELAETLAALREAQQRLHQAEAALAAAATLRAVKLLAMSAGSAQPRRHAAGIGVQPAVRGRGR